MSFVVAVVTDVKAYVFGDTQLNNEDGVMKEIGMKVLPFGNNAIVGITGYYQTALNLYDEIKTHKDMNFSDKANFLKMYLKDRVQKNNLVLAGVEGGCGKCFIMGDQDGYNNGIEVVDSQKAIVKTLLPPGVETEFCKKYITSLVGIEEQLEQCIEAVSKISDTVNNKIVGLTTDGREMLCITKSVLYKDVNVRITND